MASLRPSIATKVYYGIGAIAFGVKDNGFSFFLLLYYNQVLGLPEAWVGLGILVALVVDAVADPIVGHFSDHLHSRWGRRHPFMYAAALPVALSYYVLWNPPAGLSQGALFAYFVVVSIFVRVFLTFYEIPSTALAAELSDDYDERTSIFGWRFFFGWWGGLTIAVLAYAVFLQPDATHPVGVLNAEGYRRYAFASSLIMLAAILVSCIGTHGYIPRLRQPPSTGHLGVRGALRETRETLANRSFLMLFGVGLFGAMAAGLVAALNIYFNTYFWELSSTQISVLALANFVSAAVAFAASPALARAMGKRRAAIAVSVAGFIMLPLPVILRLVGAFPANGTSALVPTLLVLNTVAVALIIMSSILVASMLADIVEDSEVSTGRRSEGLFFAANSFVQKSVSGIGIFGSTLLLRAVGFPKDAKPGAVDPEVVRALGLVYAPTVMLLYVIALVFLASYRISRERHQENLATLASRVAD
jgi:Na+/melibiose symporter-like transporter